ncbi:MAG: type II secretion system GspH family protein [Puniceicoccales bacterium]|jgi:hypothetical protein|nr:type II secretion system GspH family protein [Puniceicoccales bacterium]
MENSKRLPGFTGIEMLIVVSVILLAVTIVAKSRPTPIDPRLSKFIDIFCSTVYECRKLSDAHGEAALVYSAGRNCFTIEYSKNGAIHNFSSDTFDDASITDCKFWTFYNSPGRAISSLQRILFAKKLFASFQIKFKFSGEEKCITVDRYCHMNFK